MLHTNHTNALSTIGEMNYNLLSSETLNLIRPLKHRFMKYENWAQTNGSQDNSSLGKIAKKVIEEFGINSNWPDNTETPYLCELVDMRRNSVGWEWKLKERFLNFLVSLND